MLINKPWAGRCPLCHRGGHLASDCPNVASGNA
jgi:hypothetical protein